MGTMDLNTVRSCWGNSIFEYVQSDSVGYSGGILCIWDPNSFRRNSFTRSDYFVIIRGVWLKSGIDLLIVVVYAPQDAKEKHMLWEYLTHISNSWDGKIVMMGDFNEIQQFKKSKLRKFLKKPRSKWLLRGDENVKFFHGPVSAILMEVETLSIGGRFTSSKLLPSEEMRGVVLKTQFVLWWEIMKNNLVGARVTGTMVAGDDGSCSVASITS
ncbi:RNA-directed DNA polymerase, eukaryota [Tanacetum coccineum]